MTPGSSERLVAAHQDVSDVARRVFVGSRLNCPPSTLPKPRGPLSKGVYAPSSAVSISVKSSKSQGMFLATGSPWWVQEVPMVATIHVTGSWRPGKGFCGTTSRLTLRVELKKNLSTKFHLQYYILLLPRPPAAVQQVLGSRCSAGLGVS